MENQTSAEKAKITAIKILAIIGFLATIVLLVWATVQVTRVLPETFSSLASLAESLQEYKTPEKLSLETDKDIVNSGESFRITWNDFEQDGTFLFNYECTDGVTVEIESADAGLIPMDCGDTLSFPETVTGLSVTISSRQRRFVDVPFIVAFESSEDTESDTLEATAEVTVVNATIPRDSEILTQLEDSENDANVIAGTDDEAKDEIPATQVPYTGHTEEDVATEQIQTASAYQSDPNGYTDLQIRELGVDTSVANRVALRFSVQNIGTKTSDHWDFRAVLPTGIVYDADRQAPLRPSERVDFTLAFTIFNGPDTANISVTLHDDSDTNPNNNSFSSLVRIAN
jgi:hypothetical protein